MAEKDYSENEGADFSKFFDRKKQERSQQSEQSLETSPYLTISKRTKTLLVILIVLMAALGVALYLNSSQKKPTIPTGFHFVTPLHQPARLEPNKNPDAK